MKRIGFREQLTPILETVALCPVFADPMVLGQSGLGKP